jgi:hypothetical protein
MPLPYPEAFADAIADCETGHLPEAERDSAVGDGGRALGRYQIHEIFVRNVNRILRRPVYQPADRSDPVKARDMTLIHATHYWDRFPANVRTLRNMARVHNNGPTRWMLDCTLDYAAKFDRRFEHHKARRALKG